MQDYLLKTVMEQITAIRTSQNEAYHWKKLVNQSTKQKKKE